MDLYKFCWKAGKRVVSYSALIARKCPIIWICTHFVGNQEKRVVSYNALIARILKCAIMHKHIPPSSSQTGKYILKILHIHYRHKVQVFPHTNWDNFASYNAVIRVRWVKYPIKQYIQNGTLLQHHRGGCFSNILRKSRWKS